MRNTNRNILSEEEKKRAAYALNMCMVSVSQIIDYNDIHILEQEYDAILNNLNLEEMPKDDALLNVLKDLLDVITHFKVSEIDKQFIEREYQQKMKNAIWAAVPNFGMILAGGNPLTMAISLANQVGIGYMNYRRNKEEYVLERDCKIWQLKRIAIEQFNFIRKELFDCAWRLADKYSFPDVYRLSEKQIKTYNSILQDQDVRRKYERLDTIKNNFEAYPPFWYFIGNAANLIANDMSLELSSSSRDSFRMKALEYFEKFEDIEQNSILREDVMSASCALEHIDLLLLEGAGNKEKINNLLNKAVKMSGNALDILQLCAITYLKIGNMDEAAKILRNLVNEGYNKIVNAQMLSAIYVNSINAHKADYEILASRVNPRFLFPMPKGHKGVKQLEAEFESQRKEIAKQELEITLYHYTQKYAVCWNAIFSTFELNKQYPEDFFCENETSQMKRKREAERIFGNTKLTEEYRKYLLNCNFQLKMSQILNDMMESLLSIDFFSEIDIQEKVEEEIKKEVIKRQETIDKIRRAISGRTFRISDYDYSQSLTLSSFTASASDLLKTYGNNRIDNSDIRGVATIESDLLKFCTREELTPPEVAVEEKRVNKPGPHSHGRFDSGLFGHGGIVEQKNADFLDSMVYFVSNKIKHVTISSDGQAAILLRDDPEFKGYFQDAAFKGTPEIEAHAVMVIHDKTKKSVNPFTNIDRGFDLIFTTDGIVDVHKGKVGSLTPYNKIKLQDGKLCLHHSQYDCKSVDKFALAGIIQELGKNYARDLEDHVEYIPGIANMKILLDWFKQNSKSMESNINRVIAIPTKENLEHLGYFTQSDLNTDRNLIQCYYESSTGDVLGMRVVSCEGIDSRVQKLLLENNGMLFVGR